MPRTETAPVGSCRRLAAVSFVVCLLAAAAVGCGRDPASTRPAAWDTSRADVTGPPSGDGQVLNLDLYIDATVSMAGFIAGQTPALNDLVRDLEGAARSGWRDVAVRYFKFGTKVVESPREPFLLGLREGGFFREPGVFEKTNIDAVLAQSDATHLTLVLTDLFQNAGDMNAVVGALKENVIAKGVAVGVLPVPSEFNGVVYDANVPPYPYRSKAGDEATYRAFYLLMFGNRDDMQRLVDVIGAKPYVNRERLLLLAAHVTRAYSAEVPRDSVSKTAVLTSERGGQDEFFLDLRDGDEATLTVRLRVDAAQSTPRLRADRLELSALRRTAVDERATNEVTLAGPIAVDESGELRLPLALHLGDPPGWYSYRLDLQTPSLNAFDVPDWVASFDSSNPTSRSDSNKTLNLAPFVRGLMQAQASVHRSTVARVFLTIRKR